METSLVFLAKCAICILIVCVALQWRADHAPVARKGVALGASAPQHAAGFVQDALGSLTAPEVKLELGGPLAPGVVKVTDDEENYLHVVMPLRIPG